MPNFKYLERKYKLYVTLNLNTLCFDDTLSLIMTYFAQQLFIPFPYVANFCI